MPDSAGPGSPDATVTGLPKFSAPRFGGNVLRELSVDGRNVIRPWGVEFADSSAFYSLEDGFGYRYNVLERRGKAGPLFRELHEVVRMREGLVGLELAESLEGPRVYRRTCTLTCLEDTMLMDFVLRYRFLAESFPMGYIAGRILPFAGSCIYHQYPVDRAVVGNVRYSIHVEVVGKTVPAAMQGNVYLRDGEDAWVLHLRMLPVAWEKEVIKLCSRWFGTRPLPQRVSQPLLRVPRVKKTLWYRGEQRPWRNRIACVFSPNAYPLVRLKKGEILQWDAVCRIGPPLEQSGHEPSDGMAAS